MSAKRIRPASDDRVERAIELLNLLSSTEDSLIGTEEAKRLLNCTDADLDESIGLISTLADRESGARAIIFRDHGDIVLASEVSQLMPLRLTTGQGAVLAAVLDDLAIDCDVRERLERALLPVGWPRGGARHVASTTSFGSWFAELSRACHEGLRCRISYRSHGASDPTERTVDPQRIETVDGTAYLVAWDVDKDGPRRYRLERISSVVVTSAPAHPHPAATSTIAQSLATTGVEATLALRADADIPVWAGITAVEERAHEGTDADAHEESVRWPTQITVRVGAPAWLFDQVLAAAGSMRIMAPQHLVDSFLAYARTL